MAPSHVDLNFVVIGLGTPVLPFSPPDTIVLFAFCFTVGVNFSQRPVAFVSGCNNASLSSSDFSDSAIGIPMIYG
jgi:hypothetical protein